jgi:hypothetical protein
MSASVFVRKDAEGQVVALSRNPVSSLEPGWCSLPGDAPEVLDFIEKLSGVDNALRGSDLSFVRVLEDVIDLLIDHSVIRFTDLPQPAQDKLLQRRNRREERRGLRLLDDEYLL